MIRITELRLPLEHPPEALAEAIRLRLGLPEAAALRLVVVRKNHDARKQAALAFIYTVDIEVDDEAGVLARVAHDTKITLAPEMGYHFEYQAPAPGALRPVVIGFGPAGIFAALLLAQMGFKPLVLERGKAVRERTKDTWAFWRQKQLDPESNVQFGEGGAGTFSDGKLYSQIKDPRHLSRKVLSELVKAGAPEEILFMAKPHIGTFRLVRLVEHLRHQIESLAAKCAFKAASPAYKSSKGKCAAFASQAVKKSRRITSF